MSSKYTEIELRTWYLCKCPQCGWRGLSRDCAGGGQFADTGDYNDVVCPVCIEQEKWIPVEDDDEEDSPIEVEPSST